MNAAAANILAKGFLDGFIGVFNAMLSKNYQYALGEVAMADEAALRARLETCPVQMIAVIQEGLGQVAVLFSNDDALGFLAALTGAPAGEEIAPADKDTLREVAEPSLGGGVSQLMSLFGRGAVQLEGVKVDTSANAGALAAAMGGTAIAATVTFETGDGASSSGMVLFSEGMDSLVPAELLSAKPAGAELQQPSLSSDELSDILGGFPTGDAAPPHSPPLGSTTDRRPPSQLHGSENLDLVLDIRLLATARLGRVEMPLSDILSLGPGSILEVGQMVDEPIELLINDKLIARGDVVVVDEKFGLRITEIVSQRERIESLR